MKGRRDHDPRRDGAAIVNGPGRIQAANIGISLPRPPAKLPACPVYIDGKKKDGHPRRAPTMNSPPPSKKLLDTYVSTKYPRKTARRHFAG